MSETSLSVAVSLVVSVVVALITLSVQCGEQHECLRRGACVELGSGTCSFTNVVSASGWRVFNSSDESMQELERGVCAVGRRQAMTVEGLKCVRHRSYPDATEREIMKPSASTYHERACGAWISTQTSVGRYWSFYDEADVASDVANALFAKYRVRTASGAPSKFRSSCIRMVTSGSAGPAGAGAYSFLVGKLPPFTTMQEALRSIGVLAAHFCDAPAQIGLSLTSRVVLNITNGVCLDPPEVVEHLYAAGASRHVQDKAMRFSTAIQNVPSGAVSEEDALQILLGATESEAWAHSIYKGSLPAVYRFMQAFESEGAEAAHSYLLGLAARCGYSVRDVVYGSHTASRRVAGMGRLEAPDRLMHVDGDTLTEATTMTFGHLKAKRVLESTRRDQAVESCNDVMVDFFPDHADRVIYDLLVSQKLYNRTGEIVGPIRSAVAAAIRGSIISSTLADPEAVAQAVEASTIRVAGAPAETWGGRFQPLPTYDFASTDGAMVMLLKAANSLFSQRVDIVTSGGAVDNLPPMYSSLSRNAYFFPSFNTGVVLPGLLVPPLADGHYDSDSLLSRVGWIIAHEFAHVTAYARWNSEAMDSLLVGYAPSTHVEAIADVVATVAIHSLGVEKKKLCLDLSQVWCGVDNAFEVEHSHPKMNKRGDLLCDMLERLF